MITNLRGGLGNQIIQISYAMQSNKKVVVNTNAICLRVQLKNIDQIYYRDLPSINYLFGGVRKLLSLIKSRAIDITLFNVSDGYFQYGDISNLFPKILKKHLVDQIVIDSNINPSIDIVMHIRGGDYLTGDANDVYEVCGHGYYSVALKKSLSILNKKKANIFIVTNDIVYCNDILKDVLYSCSHNIIFYCEDEWKDFSLIYRSKIAIIPNSTFSLSARMLNDKGVTFAPKKWFSSESKLIAPFHNRIKYLDDL
jgi:hypothetical protein